MNNIPEVKLGLIAVSRDCFVISLSERRRAAVWQACEEKGMSVYEAKTTVENETDMVKAVEEVKAAGCNALVVFLGNFGPETPETLIAQRFDGPVMYAAAAEESGNDLIGCLLYTSMGGEDWKDWIAALQNAGVLADGAVTVAYSYIGPEITYPMYTNGSIGKAKEHLFRTSQEINKEFSGVTAYILSLIHI